MNHPASVAALLLTALLTLCGCSLQRLAVNKLGDALSEDSAAVARDDDPEFVRVATPFSLKLMEGLLLRSPRHRGLLLATARGFSQYSYAFLQTAAERAEVSDYESSRGLQLRARRMYLRARDYGLRGLEVRHPGLAGRLAADPVAALRVADAEDASLLYWTAVAWAAAVSQAKDDPTLIGDLPIVDALVARTAEVAPSGDAAALESFQISYEMARAGRADVARAHFERALSAAGGRLVSPFVAYAEAVCVAQRERAEFLRLLGLALAIDADREPDLRLENLVMQDRARWLLGRVDDLFLEHTP